MVYHGVNIAKAGGTYMLASTQGYQTMDTPDGERPLVRVSDPRGVPQGAELREGREAAGGADAVPAIRTTRNPTPGA